MLNLDPVILGIKNGDLSLTFPGGFNGGAAVVKPITEKGQGILGPFFDSITYHKSTFLFN